MINTKFLVKVSRSGALASQYIRRMDPHRILMTTDRKRALLMGKLTANDAANAIQNSRCIAELIPITIRPHAR